jgi:hypothetical protein
MDTELTYFSVIRQEPKLLIISGKFNIKSNEDVRLVRVESPSIEVLNCYYKIETINPVKEDRVESRADGFTFPWANVDADVYGFLIDQNDDQVGDTCDQNTADAPIL